MNETDKRAVIWDVDGTLVDTGELHFRAWVELAESIQQPFTRADFAATFGWRNPEIIPKLFGTHRSEQEVIELGDRKEAIYRAEAAKGVNLLPGVNALLAKLHATGFKQAIGSSAPRHNLDLILELTNSASYFDAVIAMEDTQNGKPHPEVFLRGAERLGVPPARCLVMEDAPAGVQAARAGGMKCIGITFVGHHSAEKLKAAGADRVVQSLEEVTVADVDALLAQ